LMKMTGALLLVVVVFALVPVAAADAVGNFNITKCNGGSVTFTATTITFSPSGTVSGTGCDLTGQGTAVSYSGGTLGSGVMGNVKNITYNPLSTTDQFLTFQGTSLDFVLTGLGPGVANTDCTHVATPCSIVGGNPLILSTSGGFTALSLNMNGTITDGGTTNLWSGVLGAQWAGISPASLQTTILGGGSITTSNLFFEPFQITSSPTPQVPEPCSLLLLGTGALGFFGPIRRKLLG
jgi:hypothetical protein